MARLNKFPVINHISDVLWAIEGSEDFIVAKKNGYTVINYVAMTSDTFRPLNSEESFGEERLKRQLRRECRGLIFDNDTGIIIRRPFHKFFNLYENVDTLPVNLDFSDGYLVAEKLDGSMIAPFITSDGVLRWGTKMGETDVSRDMETWINANWSKRAFDRVQYFIELGWTPIFEWTSPRNQIVVPYEKSELTLTAVRDMVVGEYYSLWRTYEILNSVKDFPIVNSPLSSVDIDDLVLEAKGEVDREGYVIYIDDVPTVKIKNDWYLAIHKAKDNILYERHVINLILDEKIDDVIPFLPPQDKERVEKYRDAFWEKFHYDQNYFTNMVKSDIIIDGMSRKEWAIDRKDHFGPYAGVVFQEWDNLVGNYDDISTSFALDTYKSKMVKPWRNATISNSKLREFKEAIGFQYEWNERDF